MVWVKDELWFHYFCVTFSLFCFPRTHYLPLIRTWFVFSEVCDNKTPHLSILHCPQAVRTERPINQVSHSVFVHISACCASANEQQTLSLNLCISNASFKNLSPVESSKNHLLQNPPTHSSTYLSVWHPVTKGIKWAVCAQALAIMLRCVCVYLFLWANTRSPCRLCKYCVCWTRCVSACVSERTRVCCIWLLVHAGQWVGVFLSDLSRSRLYACLCLQKNCSILHSHCERTINTNTL